MILVLLAAVAGACANRPWVRSAADGVTGALEPYFGRWRGSDVYSTFEATLTDGGLHGTLHERVNRQWKDAAEWSAARVAD